MNRRNIGLPQRTYFNKTVYGVKTHWHSGKEKVPSAVVSKEGHFEKILGHERTHYKWFPWKKYNCEHYFLLPTSKTKFSLINEWPTYTYIYIYIYIYTRGAYDKFPDLFRNGHLKLS